MAGRQILRGTNAQRDALGGLSVGEFGFETDTKDVYIGAAGGDQLVSDASAWAHLGGQDQAVKTTSRPAFVSIVVGEAALHGCVIGIGAGNPGVVTGTHFVGIGEDALKNQTSALYSTAVGFGCLCNLTSGNFNQAYGFNCMRGGGPITGGSNCAFGDECLGAIVDANMICAFGSVALHDNVSGSHSSVFGYNAAHKSLAGYMTVFGKDAACNVTTGNADTIFGRGAMFTGNGTGCCMFGDEAGYWETGNSRLFIDNERRLNEADARAKAIVYGIMDSAVANQRFYHNSEVCTHLHQAAPANGEFLDGSRMIWWLDEGNSKLMVKIVYADGTTFKSGEVALT